MSRVKKSKVEDVTKLRKILDNPSDPALKALISKDEVTLESVRRRLAGYSVISHSYSAVFLQNYHSLEPRVTVRPMVAPGPQVVPSSFPYISATPLPEFTSVSSSVPEISAPAQKILFSSEDLFEVEKVNTIIPEFLEVTAAEAQNPSGETTTADNEPAQADSSELPEWQPIQEIQTKERAAYDEEPVTGYIEQFEQPESTFVSDTEKEPLDEMAIVSDEVATEPQFMIFSKAQIRAAKKEQKKRDKEEKRRKKLEQKQIKIEQREKEREAQRLISEQSSDEQPEVVHVSSEAEIQYLETPQSTIEYNAFNGITCIDDKTAEILYRNGYFSIDNLQDATIDDLTKIPGIRRTHAKQIKKEIGQKAHQTEDSEFVPTKYKKSQKKTTTGSDDAAEWESLPTKKQGKKQSSLTPFTYKGYTLYKQKTRGHNGKNTIVHFFSKQKPSNGQRASLPVGFKIVENKKTGVPYLKKNR